MREQNPLATPKVGAFPSQAHLEAIKKFEELNEEAMTGEVLSAIDFDKKNAKSSNEYYSKLVKEI